MKRNNVLKAVAVTMGAAMSMTMLAGFGGCSKKSSALVLMSEELNELFSPFYSTAGSDMEVVGQTQIGMFTTDKNGKIAYGENEACVALNWDKKEIQNAGKTQTEYYFVLKPDILFSDGVPLTMGDVLFNMYVYLDPAFTGSSTMYSTDIVGLQAYRTQQNVSGDTDSDQALNDAAKPMMINRRTQLINAYYAIGHTDVADSYDADPDTMERELRAGTKYSITNEYKRAVGVTSDEDAREQLVNDYKETLEKFGEELQNDYKGAKDAYTDVTTPFPSAPVYYNGKQVRTGFDEVTSFMYTEGFVEIEYERNADGTKNKSKIERATLTYNPELINTEEKAIQYVKDRNISTKFDQILLYWATGSQMQTEFLAKAKDIILHERLGDSGQLTYPSISGIVSLGHNVKDMPTVEVNGTTYKIAHEHNPDGTPKNEGEYDVLRITINGVDPKAEWNFGFTVAPHHYYSDPDLSSEAARTHNATCPANEKWDLAIDIENNKFGVAWASYEFHTQILQGVNEYGAKKNRVPLGAGAYVATDRDGGDHPGTNDFVNNNIVYYKANEKFLLGAPKIKELQYRVVSSSNAIGALQSGEVHFVTPQFTRANSDIVMDSKFEKKGFKSISSWQLGYGYIGINAGFVPNINHRRAIMYAMNTSLALSYYKINTCVNIYWPMSAVSWAYPREDGYTYDGNNPTAGMLTNNGRGWASTAGMSNEERKRNITELTNQAGGPPSTKLKFTIAGSSMSEHPCYQVFLTAVQLLTDCGWDVEVQADTNALTKLATGSLQVWAAAWGSTLDPDMYQVYHKNSSATSIYAWGYREILADQANRKEENDIINKLSKVIDDARKINDQTKRTEMYKEAMGYVLDLAVELPVYQRQTLYVINLNVIKEDTLAHDDNGELLSNPYASPLNRIWEVELA